MHRLRFTVLLLALLAVVAGRAESATRMPVPIPVAQNALSRPVFSSEEKENSFLQTDFSSGGNQGAGQGGGYIMLAGGGISLNQAISMVERRFKARVVRSDVRQEGDRKIYVLRLLDDSGNAQVVRVDAASGQIM